MMGKTYCTLFALCCMAAAAGAQDKEAFGIRGRVIDATGKPVAGATIRLLAPGFSGFEVDEKTKTDAQGGYHIAAPRNWSLMDMTQRQELALLAVHGRQMAAVQFYRTSAPPTADVELKFSNPNPTTIAVLSPDLQPVIGAKVKLVGLNSDTIRVDLTEAEARQYARGVKKTAVGYVISTGIIGLPEDLQIELGATDSKGFVSVANVPAANVGMIAVSTDEFGEQAVAHYPSHGQNAPDWPQRIVLKKTGRIAGQLLSPVAGALSRREVALQVHQEDMSTGLFHSGTAKVVTDSEGKFEVPRIIAGQVQADIKFDPTHRTRPEQVTSPPQLKAGETLNLKIALKPAVRVEGRVLDADSKKPIPDVHVRAFFGVGFESAKSDAEGKFIFWMAPGETAFHPNIPEGYLSTIRPSDYFDPVKQQQRITIFKVPDAQSFEAPPILLQRATTARGVVVDDQGRALPGSKISGVSMSLDRRLGQPKPREVVVQANERGEFAIADVDPREPLRLRVTAGDVSKVLTLEKPGKEAVRVVIAANERFHITGLVQDAEGKPVADATLELWHRDWQPVPAQGEPKRLEFKEPIRADAHGRFKTPALLPDGYYRFTVRAAGAKTTESPWLDATIPDAAQVQRLVVTRLGGTSGIVRDRDGKPVAGVQVALFAKDTHTETTTDSQGVFKAETPAGKPFCVVVRHPDFRVTGCYYEKNPPSLDQTMVRLTESAEPLSRRVIVSKADRDSLFKQIFKPFKEKFVKSTNTQDKVMTLQSLTGPAPAFVMEYLEKNPLQPAMYNEMLLTQVAMKRAEHNPEEAEEVIGRMSQGAQKSMCYSRLVDALPEKEKARKLDLLAEALIGARAEKAPELRAITLGQVGHRLWKLGEKERATAILREGEKIAQALSTSSFAGYARGSFATDLALLDLPAALALMKDPKDPSSFARHHGNTAHRIAGIRPAEAVKILDMIPPPQQNLFNQRDQYAIRVCYRMAQADLPGALKLADSIGDIPSRAYALGAIAQAIARKEPKQATELVRRAYALLEEESRRPEPPQLTGPLVPGAAAAALLLVAEQTDPTLVRECLWRSVALQRPQTEDRQKVWRYTTGNNALAMAAARYDSKLAEFLLAAPTREFYSREAQLAEFLVNPKRVVEQIASESNAKRDRPALLNGGAIGAPGGVGQREQLQLIGYLAATEEDIPRLILNALGAWRIDVEDIDF